MPAAAAVIVAGIGSGGLAAASGATIFGLSTTWSAIAIGVASASLSLVGQALAPKPKAPDFSAFRATLRDRSVMIRQPVVSRKLVYGKARVSGPLVYVQSTENNTYLHLVIALASHRVQAINDVYLDDTISTDPKFSGLVRIEKFLGTDSQAASANLISESGGKWTSAHQGKGIAYLYVRLRWDENVWTNGIPSIKADVEGANEVYDPRDTGTGYSRNPALLIRHYLKDPRYGLGCDDDEIDDNYFIAAANTCDESISLAGGGTENRYYCDGVIDTANSPQEILQELLTSCGGRLVYSGGKWRLYVAAWDAPTLSFDEGDLVAPIKVRTRVSAREAFSAIKGVYVSPENLWVASDYPAIKSEAQRAALGLAAHRYKDHDLPFTTSPTMAQRLAKIELLKARQPITVEAVFNLSAFRFQAGDTIMLSNTRFGWTDKEFECVEWALAVQQDQGGNPALVVRVMLRETVSTIYDWSTSEEQTVDDAPNTDLPDPFTVALPTAVSVSSGTAQLYTRLDGTIFSRMLVRWTAPADAFVTSGGRIQGQKRGPTSESPTPEWVDAFEAPGDAVEAYVLDVQDGQEYEVRLRSVNSIGIKSDWTAPVAHTVVGKTTPPSNVTGFSAQQNGTRLTFRWNQIADLDLAGYEIRYMAAPFIWENATVVTSVTRGTLVTNEFVPPGNWVLGIKARDTSENYSTSAATFPISVSNSNDVIYDTEEAPRWPGTLHGFLRHDVSGTLVPDSTVLASAMTDAELWDEFNAYPVTEACYVAKQIDVLFDAERLRVWGDMSARLGAGETAGVADPQLDIDYRAAASAYDGFEPWTIGILPSAARYVKHQACIYPATGNAVLTSFKPVVDVEERTQAISQTIAAGGSYIAFNPPFHTTPRPSLTAEAAGSPPEGRYVGWTGLSGTGGTFHVFNPAGSSVGGDIAGDVVGA
jgi:hypothetical protein